MLWNITFYYSLIQFYNLFHWVPSQKCISSKNLTKVVISSFSFFILLIMILILSSDVSNSLSLMIFLLYSFCWCNDNLTLIKCYVVEHQVTFQWKKQQKNEIMLTIYFGWLHLSLCTLLPNHLILFSADLVQSFCTLERVISFNWFISA